MGRAQVDPLAILSDGSLSTSMPAGAISQSSPVRIDFGKPVDIGRIDFIRDAQAGDPGGMPDPRYVVFLVQTDHAAIRVPVDIRAPVQVEPFPFGRTCS